MHKTIMSLGILTIIFQTSCHSAKEENEDVGKFLVTSAITLDTAFTKEYVTQIRSIKNIEIRARERGFLQNIFVDEGQFVKQGQLLFRMMPNQFQAELLKAEAEAKAAEIELQNAKMLADKNIVSKNEQALAQAKLDQAKAEIAVAKLHLSFTDIRAPFDGILGRIPNKLGSLIEEGGLLTTLSDNRQVYGYFNVSEPEYLSYEKDALDRGNSNVQLKLADGSILPDVGTVEVIEGEFNNETGNIAFRARFPNENKLLRNGQTGKVLMKVPVKGALIIPQKATYEIQDKKYVFVVDNKNKVSSRNIEIRGEMPDLYVVEKGLKPGDKIILEGVQKVDDGDEIKYEYKQPLDVIAHLRLKAE